MAIPCPPESSKGGRDGIVATMTLRDEAMSVSAVWGRSFQSGEERYGHVLDPRTGHPVQGALLSAVALPSGTETDALSTALLVLGDAGHDILGKLRPGIRTLVLTTDESPNGFHATGRGIAVDG